MFVGLQHREWAGHQYVLEKKIKRNFVPEFPKLKMFKQYLCGDWPQASSFSNTVVNNRDAF